METERSTASDSDVSPGPTGGGPERHGTTRLLLITTSERPKGGTSCLAVKALPDEGR